MIGFASTYLAGVLLGIRHALEADHLAAVSSLVTERRDANHNAIVGAAWGVGHGVPLVVLCGLLAGLGELPPPVVILTELLAAIVLIGLGITSIYRSLIAVEHGSAHLHEHHGTTHVHAGPHEHLHVGRWTVARKPFWVGLLHGIAGSGALSALVSLSLPTLGARLLYVVLFASAAAVTMMVLSAIAAVSLRRLESAHLGLRWLRGASGAASIVIGTIWALPIIVSLLQAS